MRPSSGSSQAAETRPRADFTRLADRYAAFFLPFSLAVAGLAWLASGDSERGLAVMVVATPCPLILAAPIAFVAGLSRAARAGIIVKGAGALERLGGARTVLLDKTGTLTLGSPEVERIVPLGRTSRGTRRSGSPPRSTRCRRTSSPRASSQTRGRAARRSRVPTGVTEDPGSGITGDVDGHRVAVGSAGWLEHATATPAPTPRIARSTVPTTRRASPGCSSASTGARGRDRDGRPAASGRRHARRATCGRPESLTWHWSPVIGWKSHGRWHRPSGSTRSTPTRRPEGKLAVVRAVSAPRRSPQRRHGRRRHQRRARPRARRCRDRDGGQGSDDLLGDRRRRDHRRRCEPDRALDRDRSPIARDRPRRASSSASGSPSQRCSSPRSATSRPSGARCSRRRSTSRSSSTHFALFAGEARGTPDQRAHRCLSTPAVDTRVESIGRRPVMKVHEAMTVDVRPSRQNPR